MPGSRTSRGPPLPGAGGALPRTPKPYQLTAALLATHVGGGVLCLAAEGIGRTFRLHDARPGAHLNKRAYATDAGLEWRADLPSGAAHIISQVAPKPALIRVDISGPIEQRAGFHGECGGWSDGNDAIAERLVAAFVLGDALMVGDSPGGVVAGTQQGLARVLAAKAKYGRRCTGFGNEQVGSLMVWWMLAVCDEAFIPEAGQIGSIGAKAGHVDISGALAKAGEVVTYFSDPPDKIALAPEYPLSDVGRARGMRDVKMWADAFRAGVCGSPIGLRNKLTPEMLIAYGGDMFTGYAAHSSGLCDGIAPEEDVTAYALKQAETAKTSSSAQARARGDRMKIRSEDDQEARARAGGDEPPDSQPPADLGRDIPTKCASCAVENQPAAKFCMGCGASMGTAPMAEGDEEPPPSSKPMPAPGAAARMSPAASLADVLGLSTDASLPLQKAAAIDFRQVFDHAAALTGHTTAPGIVSSLSKIATEAAASKRLRAERDAGRKVAEAADRDNLCKRLVACNGEPRGRVFVDTVNDAGERTATALTPQFAEMRMATLRDLVADHEKTTKRPDPFKPDETAAREAAQNARAGGGDTAARVERAKSSPVVLTAFGRPGNALSIDKLAAAHVAANQDMNGAQ